MEENKIKGPVADKTSASYIEHVLNQNLSKQEASRLSPVILAWIGDGVFSDAVRKYLMITSSQTIKNLHRDSIRFVRAEAQSSAVHALIENDLSEEEIKIVKHGRNTQSQVPKHASISEYRYATGFESLLGWLYITGQNERLTHLCAEAISTLLNEE